MSLINDILTKRDLPKFTVTSDAEADRRAIVDILSANIYGKTPDFKSTVTARETYKNAKTFAGKAEYRHYELTVTTPGGDFSYQLTLANPKTEKKVPLILHISFAYGIPSGFAPEEEVIDRGVALARFCYIDVAADNKENGLTSLLATKFPRDQERTDNWGTIGMWAWAASRALDFLLTLGIFDETKIAVLGHSRLGKTALWCGAQDTRFTHVFSNNAGCSGDAITRGKEGETIERITRTFPYWFCEKYPEYKCDAIADMPFDQHFLAAAIAPRKLMIGASSLDTWADPESEFFCCHAASPAWTERGLSGFVAPDDRIPTPGDFFMDGDVAYRNRYGEHALCRGDWMAYIDFLIK